MQKMQVHFLGWEDTLDKEMATHSSIHSCLGDPMDRRIRQATVHRVTKSQTQLSN